MDEMNNPKINKKAFDDLQDFMFSSDMEVETMSLEEVSAELTRLSIDPTQLVAKVRQVVPVEKPTAAASPTQSSLSPMNSKAFDDLQDSHVFLRQGSGNHGLWKKCRPS